ncbi:hypothetical protein N7462_009188 [Penicillium macrosclerotiorum]|uniref:uncharacterized protein n=1 Tax=Penicillium macrosclerotiorum TaxID=303699 RepID=UPI0025469318|nr:uncharacterized protein N7462_009188 [Penicillium macrosclerotiorum]KAJ5673749.1 hypothetical protein N7462_009188 [Penicillium macrosclerotiorum]
MDPRLLARGLRARPMPWLLSSRQQLQLQQPFLLKSIRYNSSKTSSPQTPPSQQSTKSTSPVTQSTPTPAPAEQANSQAREPTKSVASDFDEILNKLDLGNRSASTSPDSLTRGGRRIFADSLSRSVAGVSSQTFRDRSAQQLASRKLELKLGPTLGRQIQVEPERGVDLASAIRQLQIAVSVNKVKAQSIEQKYHKRKGAVRKELRRTRWRKLFRFSFQETVKKIQRMQAQGW